MLPFDPRKRDSTPDDSVLKFEVKQSLIDIADMVLEPWPISYFGSRGAFIQ